MSLWADMTDWLQDCPLFRKRAAYSGSGLDTITKTKLSYWVTMAFVEGSTAQDIAAAGASSAAIWAARCPEAHGLDQIPVHHGRYRVDTEVRLQFTPLEDDESAVPIFDGAKLVEMLERSQR
jgi:hypothetical protein